MNSIRMRLLATLLAAVIVASAGAGLAAYLVVREEVNDLLDAELIALARTLRHGSLVSPSEAIPGLAGGEENDFVIQVFRADGTRLASSLPGVTLPLPPGAGFHTIEHDAKTWRLFEQRMRERTILVAQPQEARDELSAAIAASVTWPTLVLIPVLELLIWLAVRRGLRPLEAIASAVGKRSPATLEPLPVEALPRELQPLVAALNDLLGRLAHALQVQREFVADAAHELRTPLAAVDLQAQLVERAGSPEERSTAVSKLRQGLQRATHLVQQLLILARQDPATAPMPKDSVRLNDAARLALADFEPQAHAKGIDLGLARDDTVTVIGDPESLRILVGNLLDNAIRYTPDGGRVDVSVAHDDGAAVLQVTDSGPGIPPEERERVLRRFYRRPGSGATGSGLGLAIVKGIADRHGAALALDDAPGGGLRVSVRFAVPA
jgi:two-component system, OmpR family, sensor kinase